MKKGFEMSNPCFLYDKKGIKINKKESHRLVCIEGDLYFKHIRTSLEKAIELMMQEMRSRKGNIIQKGWVEIVEQ